MSHVTPQTAPALKAAGFPQPAITPAVGQVWYNTAGTPYHITAADGDRCDYVAGEILFIDRYLFNEVFAPTAEDILQELGAWHYLRWLPTSGEWGCFEVDHNGRTLKQFRNTNAAEACAAAYLNLHAPK